MEKIEKLRAEDSGHWKLDTVFAAVIVLVASNSSLSGLAETLLALVELIREIQRLILLL